MKLQQPLTLLILIVGLSLEVSEKINIRQIMLSDTIELSNHIDKPNKIVGILTLTLTPPIRRKIHNQLEPLLVQEQYSDIQTFYNKASYFPESYAKWLKSHGIITVPLDINLEDDELLSLMDKLDGLLLTGGSTPIYEHSESINIDNDDSDTFHVKKPTYYTKKVGVLIEKAKKINDNGRIFPIWATCLGFESLILNESNHSISLSKINNLDYNNSVTITDQESSKYYNYLKNTGLDDTISNASVFYFNHSYGFKPNHFTQNTFLNENYKIVATTLTKHNEQIIAIIESTKYPFYATQYHPEKVEFEVSASMNINRDKNAVKVAQTQAEFFISEMDDKISVTQHIEDLELLTEEREDMFRVGPIGIFDTVYLLYMKNIVLINV